MVWVLRVRRFAVVLGAGATLVATAACSKPQRFTSNVEIVQTQVFGSDAQPAALDVEMIFPDCPGQQRKVVRGDKAFAACAKKYTRGQRVPVDILLTYRADRGETRNDIVKLGDCERTVDPKDEASYETVQMCTDVVNNGLVVGVHCDRTRSADLVEKCPWFRRK